MRTIYHILDKPETAIDEKKYRSKWGTFRSPEWLESLQKDNQLETIEGTISRIYMSGHNDFPEFEVSTEKGKYSFERKGDANAYAVAQNVRITCTRMKNILPYSGGEEHLYLLIIEIE